MQGLYVVLYSHGPAWNPRLRMDDQAEWNAHAAFMDDLVDRGFVLLGGPLEGTSDAMLVVHAADQHEAEECLAKDPWRRNGLLTLKQISPWRLRLGSLHAVS